MERKSLRSLHFVWYRERRRYMRWMIEVTFPKTVACMRAVAEEGEREREFEAVAKWGGKWGGEGGGEV